MRRSSADWRGDADEPRWVNVQASAETDPGTLLARTYAAIDAENRRRRGGGGARRALAIGATAAALGLAALVLASGLGLGLVPRARPETASRAAAPVPRGPEIIGTVPPRPKATLRAGDTAEFAIAARGTDLRYGWTVDGRPAGTGPRWLYVPGPADVGRRRIEVVVSAPEGARRRAWTVRVRSARAPRIRVAEPGTSEVRVEAGTLLELRVVPEAGAGEPLETTWTVAGRPAGTGERLALRPEGPGEQVVRALVTSALGPTTGVEWRLEVTAPPAPEPPRVSGPPRASESPPAPPLEPAPRSTAGRPPRGAPVARPGPLPARAPSAIEDLRRWLEGYAAAWRARDVDALRRMGQATSPEEVRALRDYFARARDLEVEVRPIAVRAEGDRAVVRFVRRDRFRDPAGRLLLHESPPIEKELVRTPGGYRIVGRGG
jgi:hypothetical protein